MRERGAASRRRRSLVSSEALPHRTPPCKRGKKNEKQKNKNTNKRRRLLLVIMREAQRQEGEDPWCPPRHCPTELRPVIKRKEPE